MYRTARLHFFMNWGTRLTFLYVPDRPASDFRFVQGRQTHISQCRTARLTFLLVPDRQASIRCLFCTGPPAWPLPWWISTWSLCARTSFTPLSSPQYTGYWPCLLPTLTKFSLIIIIDKTKFSGFSRFLNFSISDSYLRIQIFLCFVSEHFFF